MTAKHDVLADTVKLAAQPASGQRPEFTGDPLVERLFGITLALTTELAVTRERLDTVERLLERHALVPSVEIESFRPDPAAVAARAQAHQDYLARIFRVLLQDSGAAAPAALSLAPAPAAGIEAAGGQRHVA
ncbi:MAG: hypothetical protein JNM50_02195 [Chromatiales bacterium]|jgi:hypothetical protein|nr:hypothetical protein [Chromatiales bacterium]